MQKLIKSCYNCLNVEMHGNKMWISLVVWHLFLFGNPSTAQISVIGGANVNVLETQPLNKIRYFGGVEVKFRREGNFKLFMAPQYYGLGGDSYILNSILVPAGISYQINNMWDEKTPLFRFVDVNLGVYGSYSFTTENIADKANLAEELRIYEYGAQLSTKIRLFIFMPLYISYNFSLSYLIEKEHSPRNVLQVGVYVPVSHFLKYY